MAASTWWTASKRIRDLVVVCSSITSNSRESFQDEISSVLKAMSSRPQNTWPSPPGVAGMVPTVPLEQYHMIL